MALNPRTTQGDVVKSAATLLAGLLLLGVFIVLLGGNRFWERYDIYRIRFASVKDLTAGRDVKYAGLSIGRVQSIGVDEQDPANVVVLVGVRQGFPLFAGTTARIAQRGLVGDYFIALQLVGPPGERLTPGAEIPPEPSGSIEELADESRRLVVMLGPRLIGVAEGLEKLLTDENARNFARLLAELPETSAKARHVLEKVQDDLARLARSGADLTESARKDLDGLTADFRWTLAQAESTLAVADRTLARLGDDAGATLRDVGGLARTTGADLEVTQERLATTLSGLDQLSRELAALARSLRERPYQLIYKPEEKTP